MGLLHAEEFSSPEEREGAVDLAQADILCLRVELKTALGQRKLDEIVERRAAEAEQREQEAKAQKPPQGPRAPRKARKGRKATKGPSKGKPAK